MFRIPSSLLQTLTIVIVLLVAFLLPFINQSGVEFERLLPHSSYRVTPGQASGHSSLDSSDSLSKNSATPASRGRDEDAIEVAKQTQISAQNPGPKLEADQTILHTLRPTQRTNTLPHAKAAATRSVTAINRENSTRFADPITSAVDTASAPPPRLTNPREELPAAVDMHGNELPADPYAELKTESDVDEQLIPPHDSSKYFEQIGIAGAKVTSE